MIEDWLLGADDPETEELERSIDPDSPMMRAFCPDRTLKERFIRALKALPMLYLMMLICPFWLLYEEYLLPIWWKITDWWEWVQWQHEHMPIEQNRPMSAKEKRDLIATGVICLILLIVIIYLAYLMEMQKCS